MLLRSLVESLIREILPVESRIPGFRIRNPAKDRIRNPSSTDKDSGL